MLAIFLVLRAINNNFVKVFNKFESLLITKINHADENIRLLIKELNKD